MWALCGHFDKFNTNIWVVYDKIHDFLKKHQKVVHHDKIREGGEHLKMYG